MLLSFKLPDIGEGVHEGEIVAWHVAVGDHVAEDAPLLDVMTDKVTAEIPSPVSGTVQEVKATAGQVVAVGSVIVTIQTDGSTTEEPVADPKASTTDKPTEPPKPTPEPPKNIAKEPTSTDKPLSSVLAAPATRRLAQTLAIDLATVTGSGVGGRITPQDVTDATGGQPASFTEDSKATATPAPVAKAPCPLVTPQAVSVAQQAPSHLASHADKRVPFSGIRKKIADHLTLSKQKAPHFGYVEEADLTELVALRSSLKGVAHQQGATLTYLPFFIKAVVAGLKAFPVLNATLDEAAQELVYHSQYHIGLAMATQAGLVVPVIHNADKLSILELANCIATLADKAKHNKLALSDLKGGTFTISSIGSIGGMIGLPIINYPEVGILCVNKIEKRPVVRSDAHGHDAIVIRQMSYLSMACDHRVVDGAETARFLAHVIGVVEHPTRLLLGA
jgi:pyruvate dehydrogenase E2 component (dihydrolipoamide acetyltransferase)